MPPLSKREQLIQLGEQWVEPLDPESVDRIKSQYEEQQGLIAQSISDFLCNGYIIHFQSLRVAREWNASESTQESLENLNLNGFGAKDPEEAMERLNAQFARAVQGETCISDYNEEAIRQGHLILAKLLERIEIGMKACQERAALPADALMPFASILKEQAGREKVSGEDIANARYAYNQYNNAFAQEFEIIGQALDLTTQLAKTLDINVRRSPRIDRGGSQGI